VDNLEQRLTTAIAGIEHRDPRLAQELKDKVRPAAAARAESPQEPTRRGRRAPEAEARMPARPGQDRGRTAETIVLRTGRPVLTVQNDHPELVFRDAESEVWRDRLQRARDLIHHAVLATGRIEVQHHPTFDWIGTGWLVGDDIIVTNRHVAQEFARQQGTRFSFRPGTLGRTMTASLDFLEEFGRSDDRTFALEDILHIENERGPDMALLRVHRNGGMPLATPIELSPHAPLANQQVAAIGYPARDSRIPEQQLMEDIFGDVFDKKRLAPGQVIRLSNGSLEHDCSTLGGNSGSVILDLESGAAVGLHFAGRFLVANFAVPASLVRARVEEVTRGGSRSVTVAGRPEDAGGTRQHPDVVHAGGRTTVTIPIRITVEIGDAGTAATSVEPLPSVVAAGDDADGGGEDDELILTEARPEDYENREGYSAAFLGDGLSVPLPTVVRDLQDVLQFDFAGRQRTLLDYEHFSVLMGRRRRMCIFSAVNIDGTQPRKAKRPAWRRDPRIPDTAQLITGPYGNSPKFARGHMTRREDPMWGSVATAARGNADSMHLTNAVPQMQPFNAGIWLGLEDYALQNARQDDMRVCVFTGPIFRNNDPMRFGVKIPVTFWKVIVFVHDDTQELTATGYEMSQKKFLVEEEFVFGAHSTSQRSLAAIEHDAGLSFGALTQLDPLAGDVQEAVTRPLTDFNQIRFVK
jgi:endonuclease G